jgi:hypothetical protein
LLGTLHWPIGNGIELGLPRSYPRGLETCQKLIMEIHSAVGHNINNDESYSLVEIGSALGDKSISVGWTIFVCRAH